MSLLSNDDWAKFEAAIQAASDTFNHMSVYLKRSTTRLSHDGIDDNQKFEYLELKALVNYNIVKLWQMNKETDTGEVDKGTIALIFNNAHLNALGLLAPGNVMKFNREYDFFIVEGVEYRWAGDTPAAHANTKSLFTQVIVERVNLPTR